MKKVLNKIDPLKDLEKIANDIHIIAKKNQTPVLKKYPLTFSFLSLVGFAMVMYGLEETFNMVSFFKSNPPMVLFIGLIILLATGTAFKRLQGK